MTIESPLPGFTLSPPMVADGPLHSLLASPAGPEGEAVLPCETLNLSAPESVQAAHGEFLAAGAQLHRTNTHAANRVALDAHGLSDRCEAINNSAAAALRGACW